MATPTVTTGLEKVFFVGHVETYFRQSQTNNTSLKNKLREAGEGTATDAGVLRYNNFCFREYKVGQTTRFFGFRVNNQFCVFMMAYDHKKGEYHGMTYDGKTTFKASYANGSNPEAAAESTYMGVVRTLPQHLNTMAVPMPLFTASDDDYNVPQED